MFRVHSIILSFVLLLSSSVWSSAIAQSPATAVKQQELSYLNLMIRALSSCPELIEDWEFDVLGSRADGLGQELYPGTGEPAASRRQSFSRAIGSNCARPELLAEANKVREYARRTWIAFVRSYVQLSACQNAPTADDRAYLKAFETRMLARHNANPDMTPIGDTDLASIAQSASQQAAQLDQACKAAGNSYTRLPGWRAFSRISRAPLIQKRLLESESGRLRGFDINQGFTIGHGDTQSGTYRRETYVIAARRPELEGRSIGSPDTACGGRINRPASENQDVVICAFEIFAGGQMDVTAKGVELPVTLVSAELQIRDLSSGDIIRTLPGQITSTNSALSDTDVTARFEGVLTFLGESAGTLDQMHISLKVRPKDGVPEGYELVDINLRQPRSVAVLDILRAAGYAFAPESVDLTLNAAKIDAQYGQ